MKIFIITAAIFLLALSMCSAAPRHELINYFRTRLRDPSQVTFTDSKKPLLGAISPSAVRFTSSLTDRFINGLRNFAGRPRTSSTNFQSTRPKGINIISSIKSSPYSSFLANLLSSALAGRRSSLSTDSFNSRRQPPFGKGRYNNRALLNRGRGRGRGRWQRTQGTSLSYGYYIRRAIYDWLRACKKLKYQTQMPRISTPFPTAGTTEIDFKVSTRVAAESTTYLSTTEAPTTQEATTRIAPTTTTQTVVTTTLPPQDATTRGSSNDPNEDDDDNDENSATLGSAGTPVTTMVSPAGSKATTLSSVLGDQSTALADNAETTSSVVTVSSDSSTSASAPVVTTPSLPDATTVTVLPDIPDITTSVPTSLTDSSTTESLITSTTSSDTNEATPSVSSTESSSTPLTSVVSTSSPEATAAASSAVPATATSTSPPLAVNTSSSDDPNEDNDDKINSTPTVTFVPSTATLAETSSSLPDQVTPVIKTITVLDDVSETITGGFNPDSLNVGEDILADNAVDNLILP